VAKELLVPLDGSALADAAMPHATHLARRLGAAVTLLRVHDPDLDSAIMRCERLGLEQRATSAGASGVSVTAEYRPGRPANVILACAKERHVSLIVCTTHGAGGWAPRWLGGVSHAVIREASCPVLALSEAAAARTPGARRILVLLDGSEASTLVIPDVVELARSLDADIELFQVVAPTWLGEVIFGPAGAEADRFGVDALATQAKHRLDRTAAQLRHDGLVVTTTVCVHLNPVRAILQRIDESDADIVAAATFSRGAARLVFGSIADAVMRTGGRPTLIRPAEWSVAGELAHLRADSGAVA
jgi:nucleotide-binding universal stress UspA family protein